MVCSLGRQVWEPRRVTGPVQASERSGRVVIPVSKPLSIREFGIADIAIKSFRKAKYGSACFVTSPKAARRRGTAATCQPWCCTLRKGSAV